MSQAEGCITASGFLLLQFSDAGENPDTTGGVCGGDALCISEEKPSVNLFILYTICPLSPASAVLRYMSAEFELWSVQQCLSYLCKGHLSAV